MVSNPNRTYTMLDYARVQDQFECRAYPMLTKTNARKALFDGKVIWMSKHVLSLWNDRRDKAAWRRFAAVVEVIGITSVSKDWEQGI